MTQRQHWKNSIRKVSCFFFHHTLLFSSISFLLIRLKTIHRAYHTYLIFLKVSFCPSVFPRVFFTPSLYLFIACMVDIDSLANNVIALLNRWKAPSNFCSCGQNPIRLASRKLLTTHPIIKRFSNSFWTTFSQDNINQSTWWFSC